jgi:hypothetical protein
MALARGAGAFQVESLNSAIRRLVSTSEGRLDSFPAVSEGRRTTLASAHYVRKHEQYCGGMNEVATSPELVPHSDRGTENIGIDSVFAG